jgi:hypothetical protein
MIPPATKPPEKGFLAALFYIIVFLYGLASVRGAWLAQAGKPEYWWVAVAAAVWGVVFTRLGVTSARPKIPLGYVILLFSAA